MIKMETNELLKTINAEECVSSLILVLLQLCIWAEFSEIFKNEYISVASMSEKHFNKNNIKSDKPSKDLSTKRTKRQRQSQT